MRILIAVLAIALLVVALTPLAVFGDSHRYYANSKYQTTNITGMKADIETADPNVKSGFSLETIWIVGPGDREWIEVGWLKGSGTPRMYSYCSPAELCKPHIKSRFEYYEWPTPGSSHSYRIEHDSDNQWKIYIDGALKRTITDVGFSLGVRVDVGGEVTDNRNDIGVSGLLNVKYDKDDERIWRSFDGVEVAGKGYWIIELRGTKDSMQNGTCRHAPERC